jgi:hypothetical protein
VATDRRFYGTDDEYQDAQIDLSGKHAVTKARSPAILSGYTPLKQTGRKLPDVNMAGERARANEFNAAGRMETYAANRYGLKAFI